MVQEVTVTRAEADEARAAAESATPRMQATTCFGVGQPNHSPVVTMLSLDNVYHEGMHSNDLCIGALFCIDVNIDAWPVFCIIRPLHRRVTHTHKHDSDTHRSDAELPHC